MQRSLRHAVILGSAAILMPTAVWAAPPPDRAVSYINRDTGTAFENASVDPDSSCESPDRVDGQRLSDPASGNPGNRNVHNDACLIAGNELFDGPVTFRSIGVGYISACPDPDLISGPVNGPRTATAHDHNGDGLTDECHQSGSQLKGAEGDGEYHVRLNNSTRTGGQRVVFCYDLDQDGCSDETIKDTIRIKWVARS
jgi:hypothetical protein